jgi:outer membrane protein assembly factor BamB
MAALAAAAVLVVPAGAGAVRASRAVTNGDWVEAGFDAANTHNNPSESVLSTANVGGLVPSWNKASATGSAPVVVGSNVYVESATAVNSFNVLTGALQWSFPAVGSSLSSSVAYGNGVVYAAATISGPTSLYAIDASNGTLLWKLKITNFSSQPLVVTDGVVYYSDLGRTLFAVDTSTHKVKWRFKAHSQIGRPAIANGIVYAGSFDHKLYALSEATGAKQWSFNTRDEIFAAPSVANGIVYVGQRSGTEYAVDATAGTLRWKFQTGSTFVGDAAIANGNVYFGSNDDSVYAVNATTGKPAWTFKTGNVVVTDPVVANGVVYVTSNDKNLYALNAATGAKLLTIFTGVAALRNVVVSNGNVFTGFSTGHLRRFTLPS